MNKKIERALYGPKPFEIIFGVVLSLLLGVLLAAVFLLFKPVTVVKQLPPPEKREAGMVYYMAGAMDPARGEQLLRKGQMIDEGSQITLNEDELNITALGLKAHPAAETPPAPPAPGAAAPAKKPAPVSDEVFSAAQPNFRIHDGLLQVGIPCTFNVLGYTMQVIVQMQGDFEKRGDIFVYKPSQFLVGSLPIIRLPWLPGFLLNKIYAAQEIPADLIEHWKKVAAVRIVDNGLMLTPMPPKK